MSRIVCGLQPVREAIRVHGAKLERVLVEAGTQKGRELDALARYATDHGAKVERVGRGDLDRVSRGIKHQGVIAFAPELDVLRLSDVTFGPNDIVVALDELEDPQNFGAVIRSSVALGVNLVVWPEHHSAPLSATTYRASAGAVEHARLCRVTNLTRALEELVERGFSVVGLDANGESVLEDVPLTGPVVLVLGAEGKGLRKVVKNACTTLARLPMAGNVASLNASVAIAVAVYEAVRQRRSAASPSK